MDKKRHIKITVFVLVELALFFSGTLYLFLQAFRSPSQGNSFDNVSNILQAITLSLLIILLIVEIVAAKKISTSTWHTVFLAASLTFYYIFSFDMQTFFINFGLHPDPLPFNALHYMFFILSIISLFVFWNYTYKLSVPKKQATLALVCCAISAAAYTVALFFNWQRFIYFVSIAAILILFIYLCILIFKEKKENFNFFATGFIMSIVCGLSLSDTLNGPGWINGNPYGIASVHTIAVIFLYAVVYVHWIVHVDKTALKALQYKLQNETIKSQALRAQIKPHFIFNALTFIKALYHQDSKKGDYAMALFSQHLRANTEALNKDFVPFDQELDNIQTYIKLEDIRSGKDFNVIFDIDFEDFLIPVLSLQPYVENAIKYSKVIEKADGYIKISSSLTDDGILLEISDNGIGFDTDKISDSSCGIKNSKERFLLLTGVTPIIKSKLGAGTVITILLPKSLTTSRAADSSLMSF